MVVQPPLKKTETDDAVLQSSNNPSEMDIEQNAAPLGNHGVGPSSAEEVQGAASKRRQRIQTLDKQSLKTPALLDQAWKDDLDSGRLLVKLFELFGESIFPFIPTPEMALFL